MTSFLYHSIRAELHPPQKVCYSLNYRNTLFEARIFLYMIKLRWGHTGLKQALNSVTRVLARTEELRDRHGSHHDSWSGAETDRTSSHRIAFAPKDEETAGRIPLGPVSGKWPCIYPDVRFLTQTCKRISFCYFKWHFVAVATRNEKKCHAQESSPPYLFLSNIEHPGLLFHSTALYPITIATVLPPQQN